MAHLLTVSTDAICRQRKVNPSQRSLATLPFRLTSLPPHNNQTTSQQLLTLKSSQRPLREQETKQRQSDPVRYTARTKLHTRFQSPIPPHPPLGLQAKRFTSCAASRNRPSIHTPIVQPSSRNGTRRATARIRSARELLFRAVYSRSLEPTGEKHLALL